MAGSVIQATGTVEFEDGLSSAILVILNYSCHWDVNNWTVVRGWRVCSGPRFTLKFQPPGVGCYQCPPWTLSKILNIIGCPISFLQKDVQLIKQTKVLSKKKEKKPKNNNIRSSHISLRWFLTKLKKLSTRTTQDQRVYFRFLICFFQNPSCKSVESTS